MKRGLLALILAAAAASGCATPLHSAASNGDLAQVESLLASGADIEAYNEGADKWTPLMYAAKDGQTAAARILLEHGADPFAVGSGGTAYIVASNDGHPDTAALLSNYAMQPGFGIKDSGGRLIVSHVEPKTPAEAGGILAGDQLVALDGSRVGPPATRVRARLHMAASVTVVKPDGESQVVTVRAAAPASPAAPPPVAAAPAAPLGVVGLVLGTTNAGKIVISSVLPGSSAAQAGLAPGDHIVAVADQGEQTLTLNRAVALMRGAPGTPVDVTYQRGGAEAIRVALVRRPYREETAQSVPAPSASAAPAYSSDVDRAAPGGVERPNDFALVIGIEDYQSLPKADFGARDAEAARRQLLALGIPQRNIVALVGSAATSSKLKSYLQEWLPLNVGPESTLWVYYSGHGAPDPRSGDAYLVPWDGDPKFLKSTAYPLRQFYADLAKTKAKRIVVALDSCFSGAGGRSVIAEGTRPLVAKVDEAVPAERRLTVLAAASGDETTGTLAEQGHGAFTYYFLKGLSGAAKGADGRVTPKSLFDYLKSRVQDEAHRQNREQTPVLLGEGAQTPL